MKDNLLINETSLYLEKHTKNLVRTLNIIGCHNSISIEQEFKKVFTFVQRNGCLSKQVHLKDCFNCKSFCLVFSSNSFFYSIYNV